MIVRWPDWQSRLQAYLQANAAMRFEYGAFDCALFACGAVEAMTGVDLAAEVRGHYGSRMGAMRFLRQFVGSLSLEAAAERIAAAAGLVEVPVPAAARGDVLLRGRGPSAALGICAMHGTEMLAPARHGLWRFPITAARRAWRVG